jgi:hypothetical protein
MIYSGPSVTFTGTLTPQCENSTVYNILSDAIVSPAGGYFIGNGVNGTNFNASVVGATGSPATIIYVFEDNNGCQGTATNTINILPLPNVSIGGNLDTVRCLDAPPVSLVGIPSGGTFSGPGVNGNVFIPLDAGIGEHNIVYSYMAPNGCYNYDTVLIRIESCTGYNNYDINATNNIKIYPNPCNGDFIINLQKLPGQDSEACLYNIYGERVLCVELKNELVQNINAEKLSSGVYLFKITDSDMKPFKLIIHK